MKYKIFKKGFLVAAGGFIAVVLIFYYNQRKIGYGRGDPGYDLAKMCSLRYAIEAFRLHCGRIPSNEEGLQVLYIAPLDCLESWRGPYAMPNTVLDSWGNEYRYYLYTTNGDLRYTLFSLGRDGVYSSDDIEMNCGKNKPIE